MSRFIHVFFSRLWQLWCFSHRSAKHGHFLHDYFSSLQSDSWNYYRLSLSNGILQGKNFRNLLTEAPSTLLIFDFPWYLPTTNRYISESSGPEVHGGKILDTPATTFIFENVYLYFFSTRTGKYSKHVVGGAWNPILTNCAAGASLRTCLRRSRRCLIRRVLTEITGSDLSHIF